MDAEPLTQAIGHLSYLLLIGVALVRAILPLRLLAVAAGATAVWFGIRIQNDVEIFWESIFTVVSAWQAVLLIRERRAIELTDEESQLHAALFAPMSLVDFHRLVRAGTWETFSSGVELTVRGQPVARIMLLSQGTADVIVGGEVVSQCKRGDFVGEMAFMSGSPATATVVTSAPTRSLAWRFGDLRHLIDHHTDIRAGLHNVFSQNLIDKLIEQRDRRVA